MLTPIEILARIHELSELSDAASIREWLWDFMFDVDMSISIPPDQPAWLMLDNYLEVPAGTTYPLGFEELMGLIQEVHRQRRNAVTAGEEAG